MESNSVKATVRIAGNEVQLVQLELHQCFFDHHQFSIWLDHKALGESNVFADPEQKLQMIGESAKIELTDGSGAGSYTFMGTITDIRIQAYNGVNGTILVKGMSNTVKLERGKMLQTYSDTDLKTIVGEVTEGLGDIPLEIKPEYGDIDFSFQYFETDWQYLQRLAKMYGETLFSDGFKIVFGKYSPQTVELTYDINLSRLELGSTLSANTFEQYFHELDNTTPKHEPSYSGGGFSGIVSGKSDELNSSRKPLVPIDAPVTVTGNLEKLSDIKKKANVNRMVTITGSTNTHKVTIGCLVNIKQPKDMDNLTLGTYRVISVTSYVDEVGHFHNDFTAIPSDIEHIPYRNIPQPIAQPMQATVTDNFDKDEGLGRIQVQFPFEDKTCNYWIRTMSPEAGAGQGPNRGYVFIPEIDDEVLVSFIDGNPEKPFILGSVFHKNNGEKLGGEEKGNHTKSITDKSGSTIIFNDKDGSILIKDKDGSDSTILIDGKETIVVNTKKSILLYTGESSLLMEANGTIKLTGVKITIDGSEFSKMRSGDNAGFKAYKEGKALMKSTNSSQVTSNTLTEITSGADININAPKVAMNGGESTDISGGIVKINS